MSVPAIGHQPDRVLKVPSRRARYLKIGLIVAVPLAILGAWAFRNATSPWEVAVRADVLRERQVVYRPELEAFIVWTGEEVLALSSDASHLPGDRVLYCESSGMFLGPHGESFDRLGRYFGGPARRGIDRMEVHLSGGFVFVDPTRLTEGPSRAVSASVPEGEICPEPRREGPPGFVTPAT